MHIVPELVIHPQRTPTHWYEKGLSRSDSKEDQNISTQDITYYRVDEGKSVGMKIKVPIDLSHAKSEIMGLGHGPIDHFIGFENNRTRELIQFLHLHADEWYADVPINHGYNWDGYVWGCLTNTESVLNVVELFFEELPWFDTLPFTMRKYNPNND